MRAQNSGPNIALVFDFDETLVPGSTGQLLAEHGIDLDQFWGDEQQQLIEQGYDPANAWLHLMLEKIGPEKPLGSLDEDDLRDFGAGLDEKTYDGIPGLFTDTEAIVDEFPGASIEFFIISGGLRNVILGTDLADHMSGIYASELGSYEADHLTHIKRSVNFTEKTRYLFHINKGIPQDVARENPYIVNEEMKEQERKVPWENIIYVGDGMTDIPCFSMLKDMGGKPFGIFDRFDDSSRQRALNLMGSQSRVQACYLPKYGEDGDIGTILRQIVRDICREDEHRDKFAL